MTEQSVSRFHRLHMTGSWEGLEDTERSAEKVDSARSRETCRAAIVKEAGYCKSEQHDAMYVRCSTKFFALWLCCSALFLHSPLVNIALGQRSQMAIAIGVESRWLLK